MKSEQNINRLAWINIYILFYWGYVIEQTNRENGTDEKEEKEKNLCSLEYEQITSETPAAEEKINPIFNNKKDYCAYFDATQTVHYLLKVNFKNFSQYYQCSRKVFDENNNWNWRLFSEIIQNFVLFWRGSTS